MGASSSPRSRKRFVLLGGAALAAVAVFGGHQTGYFPGIPGIPGTGSSKASGNADRAAVYHQAVEAGARQADAWPKSPPELIRRFWQAASAGDTPRLLLYCPGSVAEDFSMYRRWTPGAVKEIAAAEPHPTAKGVSVYRTRVPFPGFPNKTVKMAVTALPDGRLVVDGRHTIWW